jgi:hypothetical protein
MPLSLGLVGFQAEYLECRLDIAADGGLVDAISACHLLAGSQPEQGVKRLQLFNRDQNTSALENHRTLSCARADCTATSVLATSLPMGAVLLGGDAGVDHHLPYAADAAAAGAAGEILATGTTRWGEGHV